MYRYTDGPLHIANVWSVKGPPAQVEILSPALRRDQLLGNHWLPVAALPPRETAHTM